MTPYKIMLNNAGFLLLAPLLLWLAGCAGTQSYPVDPKKGQADMKLEQAGLGAAGTKQATLLSALSYYEMVDDEAAQWRANFKLANEYILQNNVSEAALYGRQAYQLAVKLKQRQLLYQSSVQLGQLTGDQSYYEQATQFAENDIEKAIALTCLEQYQRAKVLFEDYDEYKQPEEFAFLYYQYGKHSGDLSSIMTALELYRQTGNAYGVVDSLYLAARLSGQSVSAKEYGQRALRAAQHLPDKQRRIAIESWLATFPD